MLKKQYRLPIQQKIVFKHTQSSPLFTLRSTENGLTYSRFGFIISKKINKLATKRNKIRRRFTASIEKEFKNIQKGIDFLFIIKPGVLDKSPEEIAKEIERIFQK